MNSILKDIEALLPPLRRYARAMTGDRARGDALAEAALRKLLGQTQLADDPGTLKVALFQAFHDLPDGSPSLVSAGLNEKETRASTLLSQLTVGSREALLLRAFEGFSDAEIASIMRIDVGSVAPLIAAARTEIALAIAGRILVIEDEAPVANELEGIVSTMGHSIIGAAPNHRDAVDLVADNTPDLILSDIQLADGDDGIKTVAEILKLHPRIPVIFITGFPERLLTGRGPEPAFLITKPFSGDQVRSAVSQAMFFADRPN